MMYRRAYELWHVNDRFVAAILIEGVCKSVFYMQIFFLLFQISHKKNQARVINAGCQEIAPLNIRLHNLGGIAPVRVLLTEQVCTAGKQCPRDPRVLFPRRAQVLGEKRTQRR